MMDVDVFLTDAHTTKCLLITDAKNVNSITESQMIEDHVYLTVAQATKLS